MTQRVVAKPRVVTETQVEPIYQRIVNQPHIERERVVLVPRYVREQGSVRNLQRTDAT